jgi:hypothetical protein
MSIGFFDTNATDDVTLHGLEKWTCHLYENLGWMTLAYESDSKDKVSSYLISIKKLKLSIESRLRIITSEDAKIDLTTLLSKVKHLYKIATKLFDKQHIRKTICDKCALPMGNDDSFSVESEEQNDIKTKQKQDGGAKISKSVKSSKLTKSVKPSKSVTSTAIKVLKVSKNTDLETLKKMSKKSSKKQSKVSSKITSKIPSKKPSKTQSKKSSKKIKDEPLIKKLSKKSSKKLSKKSSKNTSIFKKNVI